jgi:glycosyltransferase involved in cell wall biosynthesis
MRVGLIVFSGWGAEAQYTAQLANALSNNNDVTVIIPEYATTKYFVSKVKLISLPIPPTSMPKITTGSDPIKILSPLFLWSLVRLVNQMRFDVIHVVFEHLFPFYYAFLLQRRQPLVLTLHEPNSTNLPDKGGSVANKLAELVLFLNNKLLIYFSDRVILHGEKSKNCRLISETPGQKVDIIPHGDLSFFASAHDIPANRTNNVLFFGRIAPYKGIDYLIQAIQLVKKKIPDITVTIAGEGDFAKYSAMIGYDNGFTVLNRYIDDNEVGELFEKATIVVLPYTQGSQSSVISLAGSFKKPLVVTDVGCFSEMVENGKTGIIVPPKNYYALAEAIIMLMMDEKLRNALGENAYKLIKDNFSWENIASNTVKVYERAINDRRHKEPVK